MQPLRLVIVDDSRIFRSVAEKAVSTIPGIEVMASLWSGRKALEYIRDNPVDLVTLDVEMPGMDGLETLHNLQEHNARNGSTTDAIMLSGLTRQGADATIKALELGAFDFIPKPRHDDPEAAETLRKQLHAKISCWKKKAGINRRETRIITATAAPETTTVNQPRTCFDWKGKPDLICIGSSTGGPKALHRLLPELCQKVNCPIMIVQHMPPQFTSSLAEGLDKKCMSYHVKEADDGERIIPNTVYIAPGGMHCVVRKKGANLTVGLHDQPAENGCRPAVDVLFRSVAQHITGMHTLAVILTGMGTDGTAGLRPLKRAGAVVIAQDEQSSTVWGMPGSAVASGLVDNVASLQEIPRLAANLQHQSRT